MDKVRLRKIGNFYYVFDDDVYIINYFFNYNIRVKVNIKMYKKLKIKMYNFYIDPDSSESNFILFLILYELPFILMMCEW